MSERPVDGPLDRSAHLAAAETALLRVDEVVAGYVPGVNILNGADLYAQEGELVAVIGPNGAGKSTLIKSIFGLVHIRSGTVRLRDRDITNAKTHRLVAMGVGYVPQTDNVFPRLTIEENLQMGVYLRPRRFRQRMDVIGISSLRWWRAAANVPVPSPGANGRWSPWPGRS